MTDTGFPEYLTREPRDLADAERSLADLRARGERLAYLLWQAEERRREAERENTELHSALRFAEQRCFQLEAELERRQSGRE